MHIITIITSTLSFLLFLSLTFQSCVLNRSSTNTREAILNKSRQYLRYVMAFLCLLQTICGYLLAFKPSTESASPESIQLRKLPELATVSLYMFIGCYLLQTCRLVSGTGDDSGRIKVRYMQMGGNALLYIGYFMCTFASAAADEKDTWRYLSVYLGSLSILGCVIVVGLGRWLISLIHMVADLPPLIRETMITRTMIITVACAAGLLLPGAYDVVLGSCVLGNTSPYPVVGNMSSISSTTVDVWDSMPMIFVLLVMCCLLTTTLATNQTPPMGNTTPLMR